MNILIGFLTAIHVLIALFLIVLVLMQKSKDQGVGAAFGGGVTETVFGGGTVSALVRMTMWCAGVMLVTTLTLAYLHAHRGASSRSVMERAIEQTPVAPAAVPAGQQLPGLPQSAPPLPAPLPAPAPGKVDQPAPPLDGSPATSEPSSEQAPPAD
jgi:preprotein translocase subunit SecG